MMMALLKTIEPGSPSKEDLAAVQATSRALAKLSGHACVHVEARADGEPTQTFILPAPAVRLLTDIMSYLAEGRNVAIVPQDADLTTTEAAEMLNVSRPYLVNLLQDGKLPHHMVGTHRRVKLRDLIAYRKGQMKVSEDAMDELAAQAQELGLGY